MTRGLFYVDIVGEEVDDYLYTMSFLAEDRDDAVEQAGKALEQVDGEYIGRVHDYSANHSVE
jgi:hypothetical protein